MRIAISGIDETKNHNLIKKFTKEWSKYVSPIKTIYEEHECSDEDVKSFENLNETERGLYAKLIFLNNQFKKYKSQKQIIFNGSPLDVLVYALRLMDYGHISESFFEEIVTQFKILMRSLDVVYILPAENEENLSDFEKDIENTYAGVFDNYEFHFEDSPLFDKEDCPGIFVLSEPNHIGTIKNLLGKDGELGDDNPNKEIIDINQMEKLLKGNKNLMEAYKTGIDKSKEIIIK